jgi:hypothetical protein
MMTPISYDIERIDPQPWADLFRAAHDAAKLAIEVGEQDTAKQILSSLATATAAIAYIVDRAEVA